jgi:uncharacterized membrane protein
VKEVRKRSIAKTIACRAVAAMLLFVMAYAYTGNPGESTVISIVFNTLAAVVYSAP